MEIRFANSAWMEVRRSFALRGGGRARLRLPVRYGILTHPTQGLILIDTGATPRAFGGSGRSLLLRASTALLGPDLIDQGQVAPTLARLGHSPGEVRHVILTHFHADHIAGARLFPRARFWASRAGWEAARTRFHLANALKSVFPELLPDDFETRATFVEDLPNSPMPPVEVTHDLFGDGSVRAMPLPGHAPGHLGLLLGGTLVYAADTQHILAALAPGAQPGWGTRLVAEDAQAAARSSALVASLGAAGWHVMLCHDPAPVPGYDLPWAPLQTGPAPNPTKS